MADKPSRTVKVKLLTNRVVQSSAGPICAQSVNQVVDMPLDEAQRYVERGMGEMVEMAR